MTFPTEWNVIKFMFQTTKPPKRSKWDKLFLSSFSYWDDPPNFGEPEKKCLENDELTTKKTAKIVS